MGLISGIALQAVKIAALWINSPLLARPVVVSCRFCLLQILWLLSHLQNTLLGPGAYSSREGDFTPSTIAMRAHGPNWESAHDMARFNAIPHMLYRGEWEHKKELVSSKSEAPNYFPQPPSPPPPSPPPPRPASYMMVVVPHLIISHEKLISMIIVANSFKVRVTVSNHKGQTGACCRSNWCMLQVKLVHVAGQTHGSWKV